MIAHYAIEILKAVKLNAVLLQSITKYIYLFIFCSAVRQKMHPLNRIYIYIYVCVCVCMKS